MIKFFSKRRPFAAVIVAMALGPVMGMFYLNRGRLGLAYLGIAIVLSIASFSFAQFGILKIHPLDVINPVVALLLIGGAVHCCVIAQKKDEEESFKWYSRWYVLVAFIVIPLCLSFMFRTFFYEPFYLPTNSMSPNANKDDYFFVKKFAYRENAPERGDVIVFKVNNIAFAKRIVGLPGDKIQMKDGLLYINDMAASRLAIEDYVLEDNYIHQFIETAPEGRAYKILDETLDGPLDHTMYYRVPEHQYFVLGDNRDQSQDSRSEIIGFVPEENITGKATLIIWNDQENKFDFKEIN